MHYKNLGTGFHEYLARASHEQLRVAHHDTVLETSSQFNSVFDGSPDDLAAIRSIAPQSRVSNPVKCYLRETCVVLDKAATNFPRWRENHQGPSMLTTDLWSSQSSAAVTIIICNEGTIWGAIFSKFEEWMGVAL